MIKLADEIYLGSDEHNPYVLYERKIVKSGKNKGKERFDVLGYYSGVESLAAGLQRKVKADMDMGAFTRLDEFEKAYRKRLSDLLKKVAVEHETEI
jgi:hypothetical protein